MAKAYWIAAYREIHDPDKLAAYLELAGPAIAAGGGTLALYLYALPRLGPKPLEAAISAAKDARQVEAMPDRETAVPR